MRLTIFLTATLLMTTGTAQADYPNASLLIEPEALTKSTERIIILDARPRAEFDKSHIFGANWVNHDEWQKAFGEGGDAKEWANRIATLGIDPTSKVVVYDANMAKDAARIWWILSYWGVSDVKLLNGGWKTWTARELPTTDSEPEIVKAKPVPVEARRDRFADKQDVLRSLDTGKFQIVDSRSEDEFCGKDGKGTKRAGAIPGAKHLEWSDLIDPETHRFKEAKELQQLFQASNIDPTKPTATHCQSGGRASVMAFGLELMGGKQVKNYYRGWSEWGNAEDAPIQVPEKE